MSKKVGRTGKYHEWLEEDGLTRLEGWARAGLTDEQIAENMGIHPSTLYKWKTKYHEINEALKTGKEVIDFQVENALLKRALGYEYEEVKQIIEKDEMGKDRKRVERVTKVALPDTTAIIYWLKNRKPDQWRNITSLDREKASLELEKIRLSNQKEAALISILEDQTEKTEGKSTPFEGLIKDLLRTVGDD